MQYVRGRPSPWKVQFRENGKLRSACFAKKEDAEAFEHRVHRERQLISHGMEKPVEGVLMIDHSQQWIRQRYSNRKLTKGTVDQDSSRLKNYWLPKFGHRPIAQISSSEVREFLDHIQFELRHQAADRNRHRALMHSLFKWAVEKNRVQFNPVSRIPLLEENPNKNRKNIILREEDQDLYLKALFADHPRFGILGTILLWTGCRICSGLAVQWQDIDLKEGSIRIRRLIDRYDRKNPIKERQKGKHEGHETLIPLFPRLRVALSEHKLSSIYKRPTDFVVCWEDGRFVSYEAMREAHRRAVEKVGLKGVTPHGLRRTFATNAKRAGYTRSEIREMLDHSSDAVTARYDIKDADHLIQKGKRIGFGAAKSIRRFK